MLGLHVYVYWVSLTVCAAYTYYVCCFKNYVCRFAFKMDGYESFNDKIQALQDWRNDDMQAPSMISATKASSSELSEQIFEGSMKRKHAQGMDAMVVAIKEQEG